MTQGAPGLFQTIYTARSLRRFKPDPIPDEMLFQLFDAAIRAPSGRNAQDWRFVVITDAAVKQRLQAWAMQGWAQYQPQYAADPALLETLPRTQRLALKSVAYLAAHLAEVPVLVLVCGLRGRHSTPGGSIFPAVQNFLLAARALGLGATIFNLPLREPHALAALLEIPPSNQCYCLIPLGYPLDRHGPVRRKPVKRLVFWNRWEQPWSFAEAQPDDGWQVRWLGPDETSAG